MLGLRAVDCSELESIQNKFANPCYSRLSHADFSHNFDLILTCLKFKTIYYRGQHLHA